MKVSEAIKSRTSIRDFLDTPVNDSLIKSILELSSRSPSGGNIQPWKIYVINNNKMKDFLSFESEWSGDQAHDYEIYPAKLKEPYRTNRYQLGEQMYELLGIPREDKSGRLEQVMKNFNFFGAPAGLFCFVDRQMGPPQWSDLGMFLQSFMLLSKEAGLDTCAQESWSIRSSSVSSFVGAPDELMLFCGMAIGYKNPDAPINKLYSQRQPLKDWATFLSNEETT
jgi:nitroreductase